MYTQTVQRLLGQLFGDQSVAVGACNAYISHSLLFHIIDHSLSFSHLNLWTSCPFGLLEFIFSLTHHIIANKATLAGLANLITLLSPSHHPNPIHHPTSHVFTSSVLILQQNHDFWSKNRKVLTTLTDLGAI